MTTFASLSILSINCQRWSGKDSSVRERYNSFRIHRVAYCRLDYAMSVLVWVAGEVRLGVNIGVNGWIWHLDDVFFGLHALVAVHGCVRVR